jgi:NAD-dependent deacetylase
MTEARPLIDNFLAHGTLPTCDVCGGVMKPNVVLFGEMLPVSVMYEADKEAKACDVMLVVGSSLEVMPAADLPLVAKKNGAKIIIVNGSSTPIDGQATIVLREDVTVALPKILQAIKK